MVSWGWKRIALHPGDFALHSWVCICSYNTGHLEVFLFRRNKPSVMMFVNKRWFILHLKSLANWQNCFLLLEKYSLSLVGIYFIVVLEGISGHIRADEFLKLWFVEVQRWCWSTSYRNKCAQNVLSFSRWKPKLAALKDFPRMCSSQIKCSNFWNARWSGAARFRCSGFSRPALGMGAPAPCVPLCFCRAGIPPCAKMHLYFSDLHNSILPCFTPHSALGKQL